MGIGDLVGGVAGGVVIAALLVAAAGWMFARSRRTPVSAANVNDDWDSPTVPVHPASI